MTEKFCIESDSASVHMNLVKVSRLFDRNYYDAEEIGEIINDGLGTAIQMAHQVHLIMASDSGCLIWIDPKLLYDLTLASNTIMDVHSAAMIKEGLKNVAAGANPVAQEEKEREDGNNEPPLPSVLPEAETDWAPRAIDWAQKKLPAHSRVQLQELFDNLVFPDDIDKKRAWTNFVKNLVKEHS